MGRGAVARRASLSARSAPGPRRRASRSRMFRRAAGGSSAAGGCRPAARGGRQPREQQQPAAAVGRRLFGSHDGSVAARSYTVPRCRAVAARALASDDGIVHARLTAMLRTPQRSVHAAVVIFAVPPVSSPGLTSSFRLSHRCRRHPRAISLDSAPGQGARRHRRPADDRARLPPRERARGRSSSVIVATDDERIARGGARVRRRRAA